MAGLIGAGCKVVRALSRRWGLLGRDRRRGKGKREATVDDGARPLPQTAAKFKLQLPRPLVPLHV